MGKTLKEVAQFLGCSKQNICNQLRRGMLDRLEDGTFSDESVEAYKKFHPIPRPIPKGPRGPNCITKRREEALKLAELLTGRDENDKTKSEC